MSQPPRRQRTLRAVLAAEERVRGAVPEAVRRVAGSVAVAVAVTVALATWGVPTTPATPASEPTLPRTTVPMCEDVHGAGDGPDGGGSSPAEHSPGAWDAWASDLHAWARSDVGDRFAGSWGRTVAFTDDVEELGEQVHDRFGEELEIIEVNHSLEDLKQVHRAALTEMFEQADEYGPEGLPEAGQLIDVTTLTRANRVRLTVAGLDTRRAEELTERYGALHICLEDDPPRGPQDAEPAPFELDEPLGDRALLDGSAEAAAEPSPAERR